MNGLAHVSFTRAMVGLVDDLYQPRRMAIRHFGCSGLLTVLTMLTMTSNLALLLFSDANTTVILSALEPTQFERVGRNRSPSFRWGTAGAMPLLPCRLVRNSTWHAKYYVNRRVPVHEGSEARNRGGASVVSRKWQ